MPRRLGPHPKNRATQALTDKRLSEIRELMVTASWVTGKTCHDLSKKWGTCVSNVSRMAAEVGRSLRTPPEEIEDLRARMRCSYESIAAMAVERGELRTAVAAFAALAELTGVNEPKKIDATVNEGSPADVRAAMRAEFARSEAAPDAASEPDGSDADGSPVSSDSLPQPA